MSQVWTQERNGSIKEETWENGWLDISHFNHLFHYSVDGCHLVIHEGCQWDVALEQSETSVSAALGVEVQSAKALQFQAKPQAHLSFSRAVLFFF